MSWSLLQTLFTSCALLAGVVFITAFKFALKDATRDLVPPLPPEIPRAVVSGKTPGNPWRRGATRQRLLGVVHVMQAIFVAVGITSVFLMFICMAAVITLMLTGSW